MINTIDILNYIKDSLLFKKIYFYKNIGSTNTRCFKIQNKNNFIVLAEKQTRGRGRYDRKWVSPAGKNLYFSLLVREPHIEYNKLCILTALAALETLTKYSTGIRLKWPNDIIYKNKKVCGILIERKFTGSKLDFTVIGIGINVSADFSRIPDLKKTAISLTDIIKGHDSRPSEIKQGTAGKKEINSEKILLDFLKLFERYYLHFPDMEVRITAKWAGKIAQKNEPIRFRIRDNVITGKFKKVNPDGSIVIETGGKENSYGFGEII